jgi:hypothetical protein
MAKEKVCVTKVTVEYVIKEQVFTVEFDPMKVGSIIFAEQDLQRAVAMQQAIDGKPPGQHDVPATSRIAPKVDGNDTHATTVNVAKSPKREGPSLWWHTNGCHWFHPGDEA